MTKKLTARKEAPYKGHEMIGIYEGDKLLMRTSNTKAYRVLAAAEDVARILQEDAQREESEEPATAGFTF